MSKTYRNHEGIDNNAGVFRHPHTFNEISQLSKILMDDDLEDYSISKINRIKKRTHLPTAYEDEVISAWYQEDHA